MDIKEDKTSSVSQNEENDEYEEIEFASEEELIAEVKRMRRELWELSLNHSRSISDRESDELFGEIHKLQKENIDKNSKEARYFRYARGVNVVHIFLTAFALIIGSLLMLVVYPYEPSYFESWGNIDMTIPTILILASSLALGITAFFKTKNNNYNLMAVLNSISSLICLVGFFFALAGFSRLIYYIQADVMLFTLGVTAPFSVAVVILSSNAYKESSNNKKK